MNTYIAWLDERVERLSALGQEYVRQGRLDDKKLVNIRINVLGIFRSVWTAYTGAGKGVEDYRAKMEEIGICWQKHMEEAERHGDNVAAAVEAVKLEIFGEVMHRLAQVGGMEE